MRKYSIEGLWFEMTTQYRTKIVIEPFPRTIPGEIHPNLSTALDWSIGYNIFIILFFEHVHNSRFINLLLAFDSVCFAGSLFQLGTDAINS